MIIIKFASSKSKAWTTAILPYSNFVSFIETVANQELASDTSTNEILENIEYAVLLSNGKVRYFRVYHERILVNDSDDVNNQFVHDYFEVFEIIHPTKQFPPL